MLDNGGAVGQGSDSLHDGRSVGVGRVGNDSGRMVSGRVVGSSIGGGI